MYTKKPFERDEAKQDAAGNRRIARRRHLIFYLRAWDLATEQVLGHVVDITTQGVMLISEKPIELDKPFDLEIRWTDPEGEQRNIRFQAHSRWSKPDVNNAFFDTGFEIIGDTKGAVKPIQEMIDRFGFND